MRNFLAAIVTGVLMLSGSGCVMVIGVRDREDQEVVELNGETYIIDRETGKAHKIQPTAETRDGSISKEPDPK